MTISHCAILFLREKCADIVFLLKVTGVLSSHLRSWDKNELGIPKYGGFARVKSG